MGANEKYGKENGYAIYKNSFTKAKSIKLILGFLDLISSKLQCDMNRLKREQDQAPKTTTLHSAILETNHTGEQTKVNQIHP